MTEHELIEQLCRDLNQAHDELMKAQGVADPSVLDWPEWSPQANSIREAERLLGKRLAKTAAEVQPMSDVERMIESMIVNAARQVDPRAFDLPNDVNRRLVAIGAAEKAVESLGLPLATLAALKAGNMVAVQREWAVDWASDTPEAS